MQRLALRFDVDSVRCWEEGVPNLLALAERSGARFTFFVNVGYSFNWRDQLAHWFRPRRDASPGPLVEERCALPTVKKLGVSAALRTMLFNPRLGERYRKTVDRVHAEGHEIGLHGGTDHVTWQRHLHTLSDDRLRELLLPAFDLMRERYGAPSGFASPGFVHDERVLELMDELGFLYASDMAGREPFRPERADGRRYRHYQVPVTIAGPANVPLIETLLCRGHDGSEVTERVVSAVRSAGSGVLYGHPYVEGVHIDILAGVLEVLSSDYEFVTLRDYVEGWRDQTVEADRDG